ncbi:hypothetical protein ABGB17_04020 [Sphaerisporangium sp. B11E5]|uniref:hypothetical protein n=1 Tax=Sphaerisporangium sp. B11E5 TaxID=3153563 RepID=UPI00325D4E8B
MSQAWDPDLPGRPITREEIRDLAHREAVRGAQRAFQSPPRGDRRPPRVISDAERHGVPSTDTHATSPLSVGQSMTTRPERLAREKQEPGRVRVGEHPRTGRPAGVTTPEHFTGVGQDRSGSKSGR